MVSEEIYVSIGLENYRASKANILKSQADLLNSLKNLHKLLVLSRQKSDLKKKLQQTVNALKSEVSSFEKRLPIIEIPKEFKREEEIKVDIIKDYSKEEKIDEELRLINEKLEELNEWAENSYPKS
jgi:predicted HAD superfamily phosphohydrolase